MNNRRQQKQKKPQQQQQATEDLPPELSAFSLAAAIHEARRTSSPTPPAAAAAATTTQPQQQTTSSPSSKIRLPFFGRTSPLKKKNPSQVSLATNTSFNTANDALTQSNNTPAVSYFVDSSEEEDSDEETQETLSFGNDPLSVLSRNTDLKKPTEEISFNISSEEYNPEETMPSKKSSTKKFAPVTATAVTADPPIPAVSTATTKKEEEDTTPHFDVAQNVYGCTKDIWAWGKTLPIISNMLGLTEGVTSKVLDITIHMDLPTIDQNVVVPNFKKLDDEVITPAICTIWGIVNGGVTKGDEMIVQPVMTQVVPRILGPLGFLEDETKKEKNPIDSTPNPEVVPVLN